MGLDTEFERVALDLDDAFRISRGTTERTENVIVRIGDGEHVGIGGAAPSARYGETADSTARALPDLLAIVEDVGDPHALARVDRRMAEAAPGEAAARAAVSIAVHDLAAKRLGVPLYRYWGLDPERAPTSSFTVGLDDPGAMAAKARSAVEAGFSVLKVKLGAVGETRPRECVETVREAAPEATIRADANEAWNPDEAVQVIEDIASHGVEFVEQPVPADDPAGLARVWDGSPVPIAVDESCLVATDVPAVADRADVVVVKLMKTGGLREAIRTIHAARAHDLDVMLGCMVESNASLSAAAHLAPMAEYADLDGSLLLADDPYAGVPMPGGAIDLGAVDRPGTGTARN
ncbi:MAG: dipeptide epimerase [Halobacteriales archaeon]